MSWTLRVFTPVKYGGPLKFTYDASDKADGWTRSTRSQGGYWQGSFTLYGKVEELAQFFYEYLGYHVEERSGGVLTWEGMIYEMDLAVGATTRRRSLDMMANYVQAQYLDEANEQQVTAAISEPASIARYGTRMELLLLDGVTSTAAEQRRNVYIHENAYPWSRVTGAGFENSEAQLDVTVCGYVFTLNWRYLSSGAGSMVDASAWVQSLVGVDSEFCTLGAIATNTLQVKNSVETPTRVWDAIHNVADLGDSAYNLWHAWVVPGRQVNYQKVDSAPRYYLRDGKLYTTAGGAVPVDPMMVEPAVVRDTNYPVRSGEIGSWLSDPRDFYVTEVEASGDGAIALKTDLFTESELMAAQAEYRRRMEGDDGGSGGAEEEDWRLAHRQDLRRQRRQAAANAGGAAATP